MKNAVLMSSLSAELNVFQVNSEKKAGIYCHLYCHCELRFQLKRPTITIRSEKTRYIPKNTCTHCCKVPPYYQMFAAT